MEPNLGNAKNRNIFMDTYVMKKDLFLDLVQKAHKLSSMYTLADIVNESCEELDVRAYPHRGYFATISDFNGYYEANLELIDLKKQQICSMIIGRFIHAQTTLARHSISKAARLHPLLFPTDV